MIILAIVVAGLLAFANGANDNFKGVATLYGSGATTFRAALTWATFTTFLGSLTALVFANGLIANFSGQGLVDGTALANPAYLLSVGLAAALTVLLASKFGFPISTTHALMGALVGAGFLASVTGVNLQALGTKFFAPLLISPLLAIFGAAVLYPTLHFARTKFGLKRDSCVCVDTTSVVPAPAMIGTDGVAYAAAIATPIFVGTESSCAVAKESGAIAVTASGAVDRLHFLSAGVVSFARGLNDTPKLAAILLVAKTVSPTYSLVLIAMAIAVGGWVNSRKVAEVLSKRVTQMNPDQGFVGNIVTGIIVVFASRLGLPVSTTHVSCGSLFGIGAVTRQAHWQTIASILTAWVTTLPVAASLGALTFFGLRSLLGA